MDIKQIPVNKPFFIVFKNGEISKSTYVKAEDRGHKAKVVDSRGVHREILNCMECLEA